MELKLRMFKIIPKNYFSKKLFFKSKIRKPIIFLVLFIVIFLFFSVIFEVFHQKRKVDMIIVNSQSYPEVGGNWNIRFNTSGIADLTITAINETEFLRDIGFIGLKCGDDMVMAQYDGRKIFCHGWNCSKEGMEISKVLAPGKHILEFKFGNIIKYAYNKAGHPVWSDNKTLLPSPVVYSPNKKYQFNVTWADKSLKTILIEHNLTGLSTPHNDSFTGNNGTGEVVEYYFNVDGLPSGTYVWRSYAMDGSSKDNVTDQWNYTVSKGTSNISLFINSTEGNVSVENATCVNITVVNNVTGIVWMNTNRTGWSPSSAITPYENTTETIYASDYGSKINVTGWWDGNENYTESSQNYYINITEEIGYLEVEIIYPPPSMYVAQYSNFTVNVTVFCRDGNCWDVNATVMYNLTASEPDTPISAIKDFQPFYIQEGEPFSMKNCLTNPLTKDEFCNITWNINATDVDTDWKIGALFNSTQELIQDNHTSNSTISILECLNDISINWESVNFGNINPNTEWNQAIGNLNMEYNISSNEWSCLLDLWVKSTDFDNITYNSIIGVGNVSWNISDVPSNPLSYDYQLINSDIPRNTNVTMYYWLNLSPTYKGKYNGTITIKTNDTIS